MNKNLIIGGIIIVLAGLLFMVTKSNDDSANLETELTSEIEFYETDNGQFSIQYDESNGSAQLSFNGAQYDLEKTESDTGTQYESADGQVIFWKTEGQANVQIGDEIIFKDVIQTERRVEVLKSNKQGDPSANKYDFADDGVDNDCDDPNGDGLTDDSTCVPGDPVPGIGITTETGITSEATTETRSSEATDYNSSRSNRTTNN